MNILHFIFFFLSSLILLCKYSNILLQDSKAIVHDVVLETLQDNLNNTQVTHHSDKRYGYFLQLSDIHLDDHYTPGATLKSGCHKFPKHRKHSKHHMHCGMMGVPGVRMDAPSILIEDTLNWIEREWRDKLDFVIWTGDNARHDWDLKHPRKESKVLQLSGKVTDMFEKIFSASPEHPRAIPVIPCIGNNDVQPHNYIKLNDEVLPFFENLWDQWIPKDQRKYFLEGGYFAADVAPHLRVLSINTMYFLKKNPFAKSCQRKSSPGHAHFVWYKQQLEKARKDNVKVYVIGHVPPSPREFLSSCLTDYLSITAEYPDVVYGHFYSHLNMDHFLLYDKREQEIHSSVDEEEFIEKEVQSKPLNIPFLEDSHKHDDEVTIQRNVLEYIGWLEAMYDDIDEFENKHPDRHKKKNSVQKPFDSEPVVAIHVAPSVFPVYMPTIRIYRYEINDAGKRPFGALLGYSQYVSNITTYNNEQRHKNPRDPLNYTLEYDTSTLYGLPDLSVDAYIEFADILTKKDDPVSKKLWSTYVNNVFVQTQNNTFSHLLK